MVARSERDLERSNIHLFIRNPELNPLCPASLKAGQGVSHSDNSSASDNRGTGRKNNG